MSRRQSRVSIDARQNDTLLEFENFKKKFLLANKHITKLNSTLSIRIEELNAQISTLHVENLRLRASEIALAAQLKKEREKSRKFMADAEAATHNFMKHLGYIRKSHSIPQGRSSTPESQPPPPPRARRPVRNPNTTPPVNRIAREPTVPGIEEDDETHLSSPEHQDPDFDEDHAHSSPLRRKSKPRSSSSRLPLPTRVSSPPPLPSVQLIDFEEQLGKAGKRKPTRRHSGLLTTSMSITTVTEVIPPRPPSPAFGSPMRVEPDLEEEEEEVIAVIGGIDGQDDEEPELIVQSITRREKKKKSKEKERERDVVERERDRESSGDSAKRERERKRPRDVEEQAGTMEGGKKSRLKDVTNSPPARPGLPPLDITSSDRERQHTPDVDIPSSATTAMTSSSLATTRTFLTTPATTPAPSVKSSSEMTAHLPTPRTSSPVPPPQESEPSAGGRERRVRKSINYAEPKLNTKMRRPDPQPSTSKRASMSSNTTDISFAPRSPLHAPTPPASSSTFEESLQPQPQPIVGIKRKKSRAYVLPEEEEESEGTQADAEYSGMRSGGGSSGWVNIDGRRRSIMINPSSSRRSESDDARRHSLAV